MKTLINDKEKNEVHSIDWDKIDSGTNIDDLLKGYNDTPLNIEPKPIDESSKHETPPAPAPQPEPIPGDTSDPRFYYQSGKKKGQRRPKPRDVNRTTYNPPENHAVTISGNIITGALFLLLIDMLVPLLIGLLNDRVSKNKIDIKQLKLTKEQKNELEPICDAVVKHINFTANPIVILVLSLSGIYGINYMALLQSAKLDEKLKHKKQQNESNN